MSKEQKTSEKLNKDYFQSLITTRASIEMLGIAWVGIFIGIIDTSMIWLSVNYLGGNAPFDPVTAMLLASLLFMLCSQIAVIVNPLRRILYQHQRFSSVWQVSFVFVLMFQLLVLSGNLTIIGYDGQLDIYHSKASVIVYLGIGMLYLVSVFYNIFWLRSQLQKGMSEERRLQNFLAKPAVYAPASLVFIFFGILLLRGFSGNVYNLVLGIGLAIFLTTAFSRLHAEYAYAAILKWRDKSYWEEYEAPEVWTDREKKTITWVLFTVLEVITALCIGLFNEELLKMDPLIIRVLGIVICGIFLDWIIRFVRFNIQQWKKNKDKSAKKR